MRMPPSAGPRVVSWTAMMARSPISGSWQITTCSCSSNSGRTRREYSHAPSAALPPRAGSEVKRGREARLAAASLEAADPGERLDRAQHVQVVHRRAVAGARRGPGRDHEERERAGAGVLV